MVINCSYCGKSINRKPSEISKNNYCSRDCYKNSRAGKLVTCYLCGASFVKRNSVKSKRNYCCRKCFLEDKTMNSELMKGKIVKCSFCKKPMYKTRYEINHSKGNLFCSRECSSEHMKLVSRLKNGTSNKFKDRCSIEYCCVCGRVFHPTSSSHKYCSVTCQHKSLIRGNIYTCKNCGDSFWRPPSQVKDYMFCSQKCKGFYFTGDRSPRYIKDRTKLKDECHSVRFSKEMKEWRKNVYERDNYTCKLCGSRSCSGKEVVLNAHHIRKFSTHKDLRVDVNNGITLCDNCHKKTYRKEEEFQGMFEDLVMQKPT